MIVRRWFGNILLLLVLFAIFTSSNAQSHEGVRETPSERPGLEKIPPVQTKQKLSDTSFSFILNTMDFHGFMNFGHARFSNTVQIVDADEPWPPRWFAALEVFDNDSIAHSDSLRAIRRTSTMMDARFQDGFLTFYEERSATIHDKRQAEVAGYIICNENFEPIDTISGTEEIPVDLHDFRINSDREKLFMLKLDTVLDLRKSSGKPSDDKVPATVNIIQVLDSVSRVKFSWNPVLALGADAFDYKSKTTITYAHSSKNNIDWSHGTSLSWDRDGNILYSFRFIGIGKISAKDGHSLWQINWNQMPFIRQSDTIEFYAQHDFESMGDSKTSYAYSVFSNGIQGRSSSYVLRFDVDKKTQQFHFIRKIFPEKKIFSPGWGSYDYNAYGDYLLNYGQYPKDTSKPQHVFLEYRNHNNTMLGKYELPAAVFSYKVHFIAYYDRPPRPEIVKANGELMAKGNMTGYTWYKLSGDEYRNIKKVGEGRTFSPDAPGVYCVAAKYGIGYAVSKQFIFTK